MKIKFPPEQLKALGFEFKSVRENHEGMDVIVDEYYFNFHEKLWFYISQTWERMVDRCDLIEQSEFLEIHYNEGVIPVNTIDTIEKIDVAIKCFLGIEPQSINSLCEEAHKISKKKGFWEQIDDVVNCIHIAENDSTVMDEQTKNGLIEFINAIDTNSKLMLIAGEVAEASEALRKGFKRSDDKRFTDMYSHFQHIANNPEAFTEAYNLTVKGSFDEELADIVIRVFDLAGRHNVNLQKHINMKMTYNSHRPKKHGKLI